MAKIKFFDGKLEKPKKKEKRSAFKKCIKISKRI
jgi:hypothetical protein